VIRFAKKLVRFAEAWADEELPLTGADVVRHFQCSVPVVGAQARANHTLLLDLTPPENCLWDQLKRSTRYEIRRAIGNDHLTCETLEGAESATALREFCRFFSAAAKKNPQPQLDGIWLRAISRYGQLRLTRTRSENGAILAWHAYHLGPQRATLLSSASFFRSQKSDAARQMLGRANRLLHWRDVLHFKGSGLRSTTWADGTREIRMRHVCGSTTLRNSSAVAW
jgi:hypothetical protein